MIDEWYSQVNLEKPVDSKIQSKEWRAAANDRLCDTAFVKMIKLESYNNIITSTDDNDSVTIRDKKYKIVKEDYDINNYTQRMLNEHPDKCTGAKYYIDYFKDNDKNTRFNTLQELFDSRNNANFIDWLICRVDNAVSSGDKLVICTNKQYYDIVKALKTHFGSNYSKYVSGFRRPIDKVLADGNRIKEFSCKEDEMTYNSIIYRHKLRTLITIATCYITEGLDILADTFVNNDGCIVPKENITYILNQHIEKWDPGHIIQQMNRTRNAPKRIEIVYKSLENDFDCSSFRAVNDFDGISQATQWNLEMLSNFKNEASFENYIRQCSHATVFEYETFFNEKNLNLQKEDSYESFNQLKEIPICFFNDYEYVKSDFFSVQDNKIYIPNVNVASLHILNKNKMLLPRLDIKDKNDVTILTSVFKDVQELLTLGKGSEDTTDKIDYFIDKLKSKQDESSLLKIATNIVSLKFDVIINGKNYNDSVDAKYGKGNSSIKSITDKVINRMLDDKCNISKLPKREQYDTKAVLIYIGMIEKWYKLLKRLIDNNFFWYDLFVHYNENMTNAEADKVVMTINEYIKNERKKKLVNNSKSKYKYYLIEDETIKFKTREECMTYYNEHELGTKKYDSVDAFRQKVLGLYFNKIKT